jgi:hypothetical protein
MNEFDNNRQSDLALLLVEVADETLETAAGSVSGKSAAFTLAFCTGVDTCPSMRA